MCFGLEVLAGQVRGQVPELGEGWGQAGITTLLCVGSRSSPIPGQGCCTPPAPTPEARGDGRSSHPSYLSWEKQRNILYL